MKNIIIVTGGAGFIGSNLIRKLIRETKYKIISIDNYIAGSKKNHLFHKRVNYIYGSTININKLLNNYKRNIKLIFHFGEFSRIVKSFEKRDQILKSNIEGSIKVVEFCLQNNIRIIYSCTSAGFGRNFQDINLSPYAYYKSFILNLILNYRNWYGLNYQILYFFNVYGGTEIIKDEMKAVIGIFEDQKKTNKSLTVVKPGTQSRIFTHIDDLVTECVKIMKLKKNSHYIIKAKKSYTILEIAKFFNHKYRFVSIRKGERFASTIVKKIRNNKINIINCNTDIKKYLLKKYE